MAKKGIAIPYIIALILGIVVVGVIGYWFFSVTSKGGGSATVAECNSRKVQYCTSWAGTRYLIRPLPTDWEQYAPGCTAIGVTLPEDQQVAESECRRLTGTLLAKGGVCGSNSQCESGTCQTCTPECESGDTADSVICLDGETQCRATCTKEGEPTYERTCTKTCA